MPQQLLAISERLVSVCDPSSTDLTSTIAMNQVNYRRVCQDRSRKTSKCPRISNRKTFVCARRRNFYKPSVGMTDRRNGRSPMGPQGRGPFHHRRFSPPNENQGPPRTPSAGRSDNRPGNRWNNVFRSGPRRDVRQDPRMVQIEKPKNTRS